MCALMQHQGNGGFANVCALALELDADSHFFGLFTLQAGG
jgi:hypothetical protein